MLDLSESMRRVLLEPQLLSGAGLEGVSVQQPWSDRINTAALQNAVLYAREYNKNCIEADQIAELRHTPSAGTCYYLFPAEDA